MLRVLGIPTFFTLSVGDLHWPDMMQVISIQIGPRFTKKNDFSMSWTPKSDYLSHNSVTCVRMIQYRVEHFFT